jgi:hypothetical protein
MAAGAGAKWTPLGDEAHGLVVGGRIVAVTYAENIGPIGHSDAYELWWVPVDEPDAREVLFGVGEGDGEAWDSRWERARGSSEWLYVRNGSMTARHRALGDRGAPRACDRA